MALAVPLVCLTISAPLVRAQQRFAAVGVLIGLDTPAVQDVEGRVHLRPNRLRTISVSVLDPRQATALEAPHLLVPRASGFWRLGVSSACEEEEIFDLDDNSLGFGATLSDEIWATKLGAGPPAGWPEARCAAVPLRCVNDLTTSIYWVWPEYASLELGQRGECGAHPDWSPGFTVRALDTLNRPLSISSALGSSSQTRLQRSFEREAGADSCEDRPTFDPESWYIARDRGQWKAVGWSSTHRLCGYGFDYTADVSLIRLTGPIDSRQAYQQLSRKRPEIVDAHASPDGRWTLAVIGERLYLPDGPRSLKELLLVDRLAVERPLWRMRLEDEEPVMVEWALGRHVERWRQAVAQARALPSPKPPIIGVPN